MAHCSVEGVIESFDQNIGGAVERPVLAMVADLCVFPLDLAGQAVAEPNGTVMRCNHAMRLGHMQTLARV